MEADGCRRKQREEDGRTWKQMEAHGEACERWRKDCQRWRTSAKIAKIAKDGQDCQRWITLPKMEKIGKGGK